MILEIQKITMMLASKAVLSFLCLSGLAVAQSVPAAKPASGFLSPDKYTNAYFGFSLAIPTDMPVQNVTFPVTEPYEYLFGIRTAASTSLAVLAVHSNIASDEYAQRIAGSHYGNKQLGEPLDPSLLRFGFDMTAWQEIHTFRVVISGRPFWRGETEEKRKEGKVFITRYVSAFAGYLLEFDVISPDRKLADQLKHNVESATFFNPAKAAVMAGPSAHPYVPAARQNPVGSHLGQLSPGVVAGNIYTNDALGFAFKFPQGWLVADKATVEEVMEKGRQAGSEGKPTEVREHVPISQCMRVPLWATKYPEGKMMKEVSPVIAVIVIDRDCIEGSRWPNSTGDKDGIRAAALAMKRGLMGTPFMPNGQISVGAFAVQGHLMVEVSGTSPSSVPESKQPLVQYNSLVFTEADSYIVTWMMTSGSPQGLQELKSNSALVFATHGAGQSVGPGK